MVSTKIISAFLACIHFVYADNLTLIDYSQNDSNTTCKSGVLRGVDQSALKSVILLDRSVGDYGYANFEIKEELESKFKQLVTIDLTHECVQRKVKENFEFSCEKRSEKEFHITLLFKALREYSKASIRGFLLKVDPDSKIVQLPAVYEPTNTTGQLIINGQIKPTDTSCSAIIDTSELNLVFKCTSSAKPCVIEILLDKAFEINGEDRVELIRKTTQAEELHVTIKYASCRLDGEYQTINCRINMTYSEKVDHHDNTGLIIGIVFGVGFGVGIIVGCICFLCKRTVCFETIKPNPETGKEKNNINRTDPESPSAETALLNKSRTDDDKTVRVSDTTEDKVKPTTLESGAR